MYSAKMSNNAWFKTKQRNLTDCLEKLIDEHKPGKVVVTASVVDLTNANNLKDDEILTKAKESNEATMAAVNKAAEKYPNMEFLILTRPPRVDRL